MVKNPPANARDAGSISGLGGCIRKGNGNPLQYSCLQSFLTDLLRQGARNTCCFPAEKPDKAETWAVLRTLSQLALPPKQRQAPALHQHEPSHSKSTLMFLSGPLQGSVGTGCGWAADLPLSSWLLSLKMLTWTKTLSHSGNMYSNSIKLFRPQVCRTHTFFLSLNLMFSPPSHQCGRNAISTWNLPAS